MARKLILASLMIFFGLGSSTARAQMVFSSPLPPGPGQVPMVPGPLVAPIFMPLQTPTAVPVGVYYYGNAPLQQTQAVAPPAVTESVAGPASPTTGKRFWASADFFYGATQGTRVPPLVTYAPQAGAANNAGALYVPGTIVGFGDERVGNKFRAGLRLNAGYWFDCGQQKGVDLSYFHLGRLSESFQGLGVASTQAPAFFRPLVLGTTNIGLAVGTLPPSGIVANMSTDVTGAEANYRRNLSESDCGRCDFILGYRFLYLSDDVTVSSLSVAAPRTNIVTGFLEDRFQTRNQFHGAQMGVVKTWKSGSGMSFELLGKIGLGVTHSTADLGATFTTALGSLPTGLLVNATNAGRYTADNFAVVPEVGAKLGYQLTDCVRVTAGYSFLYWSKVIRAADQIDLTIAPPTRPAFTGQTTDVWIQGWTLGLDFGF